MRRIGLACLLAAMVATGAIAQTPAPALSELERALIENVNLLAELRKAQLEADLCRAQLAQPRADATAQQVKQAFDALKSRIEAAHPGFTWDPSTGAFTPKEPK